jgi:hypothetical protein
MSALTNSALSTDHESNGSALAKEAYFEFDDVEYGHRFAKAFTRAVELCGGKESPF